MPNINLNSHRYFCATVFKYNYQFDLILQKIKDKDPLASFILIRNDGQLYAMNEILETRLQNHGLSNHYYAFVDKMPHHIMMAVYNHCDVSLCYFFGGDTTSREAFEIGTPIVTLHKYGTKMDTSIL